MENEDDSSGCHEQQYWGYEGKKRQTKVVNASLEVLMVRTKWILHHMCSGKQEHKWGMLWFDAQVTSREDHKAQTIERVEREKKT